MWRPGGALGIKNQARGQLCRRASCARPHTVKHVRLSQALSSDSTASHRAEWSAANLNREPSPARLRLCKRRHELWSLCGFLLGCSCWSQPTVNAGTNCAAGGAERPRPQPAPWPTRRRRQSARLFAKEREVGLPRRPGSPPDSVNLERLDPMMMETRFRSPQPIGTLGPKTGLKLAPTEARLNIPSEACSAGREK